MNTLDFVLPPELEATEPPPVAGRRPAARREPPRGWSTRGSASSGSSSPPATSSWSTPPPRSRRRRTATGRARRWQVHFSAELDDGSWVVEVRPAGVSAGPVAGLRPGEVITLDAGAGAALIVDRPQPAGQARLWRARPRIDGGVTAFLARHGRPIRYAYVPRPWPLPEYQTVFAREPGSAEMPSAGRPFTDAGRHRPGHPRRGRCPGRLAHGRVLAGSRASRRSRNGSACRRQPPGWSTPRARRAGG